MSSLLGSMNPARLSTSLTRRDLTSTSTAELECRLNNNTDRLILTLRLSHRSCLPSLLYWCHSQLVVRTGSGSTQTRSTSCLPADAVKALTDIRLTDVNPAKSGTGLHLILIHHRILIHHQTPKQGWKVSAISSLNHPDRNRFLPEFYQNILSEAMSWTNPLTFYGTDSNRTPFAKHPARINKEIC